jgi:hypothetical protein
MATSYLVPNEESLKRGENQKFALVHHFLLLKFVGTVLRICSLFGQLSDATVTFFVLHQCLLCCGIGHRPLHALKIITFGTRVSFLSILLS